jgi:hypothetical protein
VLENDDFILWANENCVCAVGHDGATGGKEDHKPTKITDAKTKEEREICPSYDGLTCEEHRKVKADARAAPEGAGQIGESPGVPNNWLVGPDGSCVQIPNDKAGLPKALIEELTTAQKKFEKPILRKKWDAYQKSFDEGDKALADGKWKAAIAAYAKVDADTKKLSKGLVEKVAAKAKDVNDQVAAKFTELKDGSEDAAAKLKAVKALRAEIGTKLAGALLPVVAEIDAWVKENAAPPVAK